MKKLCGCFQSPFLVNVRIVCGQPTTLSRSEFRFLSDPLSIRSIITEVVRVTRPKKARCYYNSNILFDALFIQSFQRTLSQRGRGVRVNTEQPKHFPANMCLECKITSNSTD